MVMLTFTRKLAAAFAEHEIGLDGVIELDVDESEATKRLLSRSVHQLSGRIYNQESHPPQTPGIDDVSSALLAWEWQPGLITIRSLERN